MGGTRSDFDVSCAPGSKRALHLAWSSLKSACSPPSFPTSAAYVPLDKVMAGSKRNKIKKVLSPTRAATPPPEPSLDDDALMDDLLAQLDEKDKASTQEAATVLSEVSAKNAVEAEAAAPKRSRSRHEARLVRSATTLVVIPPLTSRDVIAGTKSGSARGAVWK